MLAVAGLSGHAATASAQQATPTTTNSEDEIVVTGSLIRGTPETAALPVDVITEADLQNQGSPSTLELLKALPSSSGVLGDTNQFDARAQGSEGSGTVNLRGLGPQRTLVLLNGKRMAVNPMALGGGGTVDTNMIPAAAIGRIEVLKDGAAATYGSDAIAGVVNFITKKNFEGFEVGGSYKNIEDSDGDWTANGAYGWQGTRADFFASLGIQHRAELLVRDRDLSRPYLQNPQGGYSAAGNPATFIPLGATTTAKLDPDCTALGGTPGTSNPTTPVCYWNFAKYDALTEEENRYQLYSEFNLEIGDKTNFHAEALYGRTSIPHFRTSPSYALLAAPTGAQSGLNALQAGPVAGRYFVPATNPGLADFIADNPGTVSVTNLLTGQPTNVATAVFGGGALFVAGRPYALGGNPLFNYGSSEGKRDYSAYRISAGFDGELDNGIGWDFDVTYMEERGKRSGRDTIVNRFQRALLGLGGPNCPATGGTPGVGPCMYFNPFGSGIARNPLTGQVNPNNTAALSAGNNDRGLIEWFFPLTENVYTSRIVVTDFSLTGDTPIELGGGAIAWAVGAQYRDNKYNAEINSFGDINEFPCINSPDYGVTDCAVRTGPLAFLGSAADSQLASNQYALFGELQVPFSDAFNMQIAARFEDYGGAIGSTFDPKISAKWQVVDGLALRGSAGTTFRGPALVSTVNGSVTSLQDVAGTFRAVDIFGNPALAPESATTYNVGLIVEKGGFTGTADLFQFDLEDPIITEPVGGMFTTMFPNATNVNCGNPAFAALQARFTFATNTCAVANITRIATNSVNGPKFKNSGLDLSAEYVWDDLFGAEVTLGGSATYTLEYTVDATKVAGLTVSPAFNAVDKLNYETQVYPIPRYKGSAFANFTTEHQNLRLTMNYTDDYVDQRTVPFTAQPSTNNTVIAGGKTIDSYVTFDASYRFTFSEDLTFTLSADNFTNEDPSFARLDLNYDPFTGDPIGRTIKVGLNYKFGGE